MSIVVELLSQIGPLLWVVPVAAGVVATGMTLDWVDRRSG
jgi:hypothetical protein